jgi:drug/metabolite transporter (DMT)-like permease
VRGIVQMMGATVMFVCMNATAKVLSASLPAVEIVWARSAGHLVFIVALLGPRHGFWRLFETNDLRLQIGRSVLQVSSQMLFFTAIGHVQLADATTVSFTAPLIVAALAGPLLGERVGPVHWAAIGAGFLGALIVIRPGGRMNPSLLLILGSSVCYALYQILTRRVAGYDSAETTAVYSALVGSIVMSIWVPFVWTPIASWTDAALLFSLGIIGGTAHYFVARAMTYAEASIIAPFGYWQLVGSVIVGYVISGYLPDSFTWIGAGIIVCAGSYIAWNETREKPAVSVQRA